MNRVEELPVKRQCELIDLPRSSFYSRSAMPGPPEQNMLLEQALFDIHERYPFYGYRKVVCELRHYGVYTSQCGLREKSRQML